MGLQRVGHNLVTKNNKIVRVGVQVSYNLLFSDWERNFIYIIVLIWNVFIMHGIFGTGASNTCDKESKNYNTPNSPWEMLMGK